jgi:hypothetical protein
MIAYFILVHRYPQQFKRLFNAIYSTENTYLIHVDKSASVELRLEIKSFLSSFSNAYVMISQNVVWGGYSMVDAELRGIKKLLKLSIRWDHYINLSGQDFPLKSQSDIKKFLKKNINVDYIKIADQVLIRPNTVTIPGLTPQGMFRKVQEFLVLHLLFLDVLYIL